MATDRNGDPVPPTSPTPPTDDDDLDEVRRRAAERAGEIERLSARIDDLHGQIEAYRRRRGS
ncbi:hypothetical protein [Catenuloplanes atrovinosus]|uniref:ATP-dependent protease n=1 Tax=Catenuloplanes atrovinosus TaxID=137266 RepID=A0AAE4C8A1_9ACTN|nr:hypothetical protein [Catenuloplanes atrovinosus]MDR7274437.1 putative ATP-dependent protease [Catenuloplanes atrovinosus]